MLISCETASGFINFRPLFQSIPGKSSARDWGLRWDYFFGLTYLVHLGCSPASQEKKKSYCNNQATYEQTVCWQQCREEDNGTRGKIVMTGKRQGKLME